MSAKSRKSTPARDSAQGPALPQPLGAARTRLGVDGEPEPAAKSDDVKTQDRKTAARAKASLISSAVALITSIAAVVFAGLTWAFPFFGWTTPADAAENERASLNYFLATQAQTTAPDSTPASGVSMALAYASPGSPAEGYALALQAMWSAYPAGATSSEPRYEVKSGSGRVSVCQNAEPKACLLYETLRFDQDHRLKDYTQNGIPISQLTLPATQERTTAGPLSVQFLGGTIAVNGERYRFVVEMENKGDKELDIERSAVYTGPTDQKETTTLTGNLHLLPGQATRLFGAVTEKRGGSLALTLRHDGLTTSRSAIRLP